MTVGTRGRAVGQLSGRSMIGLSKGYSPPRTSSSTSSSCAVERALVQQLTAGSLDVACRPGWSIRSAPSTRARRSRSCASRCRRRPMRCSPSPRIKTLDGPQGQGHLARRPQGHHAHLCRAHAGAERRQARRVRHGVRRRDRRRASRRCKAGAVDAAILLPPFNFHAEAAGFNNLGLTIDYARTCRSPARWSNAPGRARTRALLASVLSVAQQEHGLVRTIRRTAPRRSRSWWRRASSRRTTSRGPTISCTRTRSSRPTGKVSRTQDGRAGRGAQRPRRHRRLDRRRTLRAAGR